MLRGCTRARALADANQESSVAISVGLIYNNCKSSPLQGQYWQKKEGNVMVLTVDLKQHIPQWGKEHLTWESFIRLLWWWEITHTRI